MERFANNADSTLNGAINNVTTSIVVASGSSFPSVGDFRLIIGSDPDTAEYVKATARTGNTITVVRGQEGSSAQSWADGTTVTHILTKDAVESLRDTLKGKTLSTSLETIGASQDGYSLTWINTDGYWASRPGSPFTIVGNDIVTIKAVSIDPNGTLASAHGDGTSKLFINGNVIASKYSVGEVPPSIAKFGYVSNATQSFTVPVGVTSLSVKMWGPGGGSGNYSGAGGGGPGGFSSGTLTVTPGEVLLLAVGQGGRAPASSSSNGGLGGWPGGGFGTRGDASGAGGGGLTGIFTGSMTQANALMIAGGGGGATGYGNYGAGGGGGLIGGSGVGTSGRGGSQIAGGLNGNGTSSPAYTVGSALAGGTSFSDSTTSQSNDGGGGGSGYWGGGAGQGDGTAGGGGSGYLHAVRVVGGVTTTGANATAGNVATLPPSTTEITYVAGAGVGALPGNNGGDGYLVLEWGAQTSLNLTTLNFSNSSTLTTASLDLAVTAPANITLQAGTDVILTGLGRAYRTGAWGIGSTATNNTSTLAQAGLTGPLINLSSGTGTFTTTANQALVFNQGGSLNLQGHTDVKFNTGTLLRGYFDVNGVFRTGPSASVSATGFGISWPASSVDTVFVHNASGNSYYTNWSGLASGAAGFLAYNTSAGASATIGMSVGGAGLSHATTALAGNGFIEQAGTATSCIVFRKVLGNATGGGTTGRIYQSGAWVIGEDVNNDTSAEAQAGLTGTLLNLTQITGGTLTTIANQSLLYNSAGVASLQGNTGHNFIAGTTSIASTTTTKFITSLGRRLGITTVGTSVTVPDGYHNIFVPTLTAGITITLPSAPANGDTYLIKDRDGSATAFNIVIAGNGKTIEQFTGAPASSLTLNQNYDSVTLIYNGTFWSII